MTAETESHQPNDEGFAGDPTTPQPAPNRSADRVDGESIAVPSGDITGAITGALEDLGSHGPHEDDDENTRGS